MMLIQAFLFAPWVGVVEPIEDKIAHRVDIEGIPVAGYEISTHVVARCGQRVKIIPTRWQDLRTRGTQWKRCPACNGKAVA